MPPKIIARNPTTVTLNRAEWEDYLEDVAHRTAADVFDAHVAEVDLDEVIRLGYSATECVRMIHGLDDGSRAIPCLLWKHCAPSYRRLTHFASSRANREAEQDRKRA